MATKALDLSQSEGAGEEQQQSYIIQAHGEIQQGSHVVSLQVDASSDIRSPREVDTSVPLDTVTKKSKKDSGITARLAWNDAEKKRKEKKSKKRGGISSLNQPNLSKVISGAFSKVVTEDEQKQKPPIEKRIKPKIDLRTLTVLKAISDGKFDDEVSPEQKFQIERNSKFRNSLIKNYDEYGKIKKWRWWFYKFYKSKHYRLEKRCVKFLFENNINIDFLFVLLCFDEMHLDDDAIKCSPEIINFNENEYVENLEACNQETNGSRPLSSLSGGSKSQDSSEEKESKSGSSSGSGNNKDEGDCHPLLMAALKIMLLSGEFKPEFYKFDLNEMTETSYAALLEVYNEKQPSNSQTFLLNKKQRFWCCCKRSHFVATERRNAFLKVPDMVQCSGCQNHFFKTCVNYSLDRQSKKKWFCFNCSASKLPLLPSWGHGGSNTCTMDNVITGCVLEYKRDKKFIQLIGDTPFEEALKTFLLHMGTTVGSIAAAKQQFITKVYHNRNLYGTEDEIIFDRLITVCGVCNNFECPNCGEKTRSGFRRKNYIGQNTIGNSVAETIDNVFNLRSIEIPNMRCDNEINGQRCNANLTVSEIKYAQQYPWILPIGLANEAVNRIFGFKELEDLPAKVEYNGRQYIIGGITFNRNDHFVSILPVDGGWVYFDGLETDHPVASISDALKHVVKRNSVISTIFYFLTQSPKSKN